MALGTSNADGAVRDILLVQVEPFFKGQKEVGASTYAKEVSDTSPAVVCASIVHCSRPSRRDWRQGVPFIFNTMIIPHGAKC